MWLEACGVGLGTCGAELGACGGVGWGSGVPSFANEGDVG